jgi:hypothetical protein
MTHIRENFYSKLEQIREGEYATTKLGRMKRKVGRALGLGKHEARSRADAMSFSSHLDQQGSKESVHGKELQGQMKKSSEIAGRAAKRYLRISQGKKPFSVNEEGPSWLSKKNGGTWEGPSYLSKPDGTWPGPSYLSKKHGGTWDKKEKKKTVKKKLDEMKSSTLQSYIKKATESSSKSDLVHHYTGDEKARKNRNKRDSGLINARRKVGKPYGWDAGKPKVYATEEQLDELHGKGSLEKIRDIHQKKLNKANKNANDMTNDFDDAEKDKAMEKMPKTLKYSNEHDKYKVSRAKVDRANTLIRYRNKKK